MVGMGGDRKAIMAKASVKGTSHMAIDKEGHGTFDIMLIPGACACAQPIKVSLLLVTRCEGVWMHCISQSQSLPNVTRPTHAVHLFSQSRVAKVDRGRVSARLGS